MDAGEMEPLALPNAEPLGRLLLSDVAGPRLVVGLFEIFCVSKSHSSIPLKGPLCTRLA